jgi:hypothetical protein
MSYPSITFFEPVILKIADTYSQVIGIGHKPLFEVLGVNFVK